MRAAQDDEEVELYDRLSSALSQSELAPDAEIETLHGVFDEMLTGRERGASALAEERKAPEIPEESPAPPERRTEDRRKEDRRLDERRQEPRRASDATDRIYRKSIRVDSEKIDSLMNQVGELVVDRS